MKNKQWYLTGALTLTFVALVGGLIFSFTSYQKHLREYNSIKSTVLQPQKTLNRLKKEVQIEKRQVKEAMTKSTTDLPSDLPKLAENFSRTIYSVTDTDTVEKVHAVKKEQEKIATKKVIEKAFVSVSDVNLYAKQLTGGNKRIYKIYNVQTFIERKGQDEVNAIVLLELSAQSGSKYKKGVAVNSLTYSLRDNKFVAFKYLGEASPNNYAR